ncbi:hypothetical protein AB9K32_10885 [Allomuricauda sp. XS_ASV26]|jgi:hypothetical protein|uniref:Uncharacterized protein n=1 Tax=Flagellimonas okinawensis TaxID=3031324 RepID=A0ABT5XK17_9FLAO|nr:hypothetical protein [[Muricauda] okinawensis]MDF0706228.1 hypothetical protein [[Muricauda] okinawensis]
MKRKPISYDVIKGRLIFERKAFHGPFRGSIQFLNNVQWIYLDDTTTIAEHIKPYEP